MFIDPKTFFFFNQLDDSEKTHLTKEVQSFNCSEMSKKDAQSFKRFWSALNNSGGFRDARNLMRIRYKI